MRDHYLSREERDDRAEYTRSEIADWEQACEPFPTPLPLYALWLWSWRKVHPLQRLSVSHMPYSSEGFISPTKPTQLSIPTGYGALSMDILVCPDIVPINLAHTSGDRREGWEWGHTTVATLHTVGQRLIPRTNDPNRHLRVSQDVLDYINQHDMDDVPAVADDIADYDSSQRRARERTEITGRWTG